MSTFNSLRCNHLGSTRMKRQKIIFKVWVTLPISTLSECMPWNKGVMGSQPPCVSPVVRISTHEVGFWPLEINSKYLPATDSQR